MPEFFYTFSEASPVVVHTAALRGVEAVPVTVEVDFLRRLPATTIVGLPASQVREVAEKVRSAIEAIGFEMPRVRIVVNVKLPEGVRANDGVELAIAIGIMARAGYIPTPPDHVRYYAGLDLAGTVLPVRGSLAAAQLPGVLVTSNQSNLPALAGSLPRGAATLKEATLPSGSLQALAIELPERFEALRTVGPAGNLGNLDGWDMEFVVLPILEAIGARKPLLLVGERGTTKLARAVARALKPLTVEEAVEVTRIADVAGLVATWGQAPFRAPHHTAGLSAMFGTRNGPPGEASIAHRGVLFLDEAHAFQRVVLDTLEKVRRDGARVVWSEACVGPADFLLVAATTPDAVERVAGHPLFADAIRITLT